MRTATGAGLPAASGFCSALPIIVSVNTGGGLGLAQRARASAGSSGSSERRLIISRSLAEISCSERS